MITPILTIDYLRHPQLADNVWHAQRAGHPRVLTYGGPSDSGHRLRRAAAMQYAHAGQRFAIPRLLSRDEYPFASTLEGGGDSWVGHIPPWENSAQGGLLAAFYRRHFQAVASDGTLRFLVRVVNHPKDALEKA